LGHEGELIRRCRTGDPGAFAEFACQHRAMVYRLALGIVRSPDDAEDVAQEALLRAHRAFGRYDVSREPAGWLRAITVNCAISHCRRGQRNRRLLATGGLLEAQRSPARPEQQLAEEETRTRVGAAIDRLPPRQRAAITLFALDDLSLRDVALAMGCSVGAVKTHLHRARERLGEALAGILKEV
jgi:RNA polymerase sigma-70 factor, ECF subfamily